MAILVDHFLGIDRLSDAHFVRAEVFQKEQGISVVDDIDGLDDSSEQFVAYEDGKPNHGWVLEVTTSLTGVNT